MRAEATRQSSNYEVTNMLIRETRLSAYLKCSVDFLGRGKKREQFPHGADDGRAVLRNLRPGQLPPSQVEDDLQRLTEIT